MSSLVNTGCTNIETCAPSAGETPMAISESLVDGIQKWIFENLDYGSLVGELSEMDMMQTRILHWQNPWIELWSQPWLHMDNLANEIPNSLYERVNEMFPGVSEDNCFTWASSQHNFTDPERKIDCIYAGMPEHDPVNINNPPVSNDEKFVSMSHLDSSRRNSDSDGIESIPFCKPNDLTRVRRAETFLDQKCWVSESNHNEDGHQ